MSVSKVGRLVVKEAGGFREPSRQIYSLHKSLASIKYTFSKTNTIQKLLIAEIVISEKLELIIILSKE